jgi:hypothetical protein
MGLFAAVIFKPSKSGKFIQVTGASPLFLLAAAPLRVFPLRLVRQSVVLSGLDVQSADELQSIFLVGNSCTLSMFRSDSLPYMLTGAGNLII